jgi:hypothetical protein
MKKDWRKMEERWENDGRMMGERWMKWNCI